MPLPFHNKSTAKLVNKLRHNLQSAWQIGEGGSTTVPPSDTRVLQNKSIAERSGIDVGDCSGDLA